MNLNKKISVKKEQEFFLEKLKENFPLLFSYRVKGELYLKCKYTVV